MHVGILFPLTKAIPMMFEGATTHYQTLQTWISHNATRYYNFSALLHVFMCCRTFFLSLTLVGHNATCYYNFNVLPHAIPSIFTQFSMGWGYLQRVTTRYRQIYKKKLY